MLEKFIQDPLPVFLLVLLAVLMICFLWLAAGKVWELNRLKAWGPRRVLLNQLGRVIMPITAAERGKVVVNGEIWDAVPDEPLPQAGLIEKDAEVRVTGFDPVNPWVVRVSTRMEPAIESLED